MLVGSIAREAAVPERRSLAAPPPERPSLVRTRSKMSSRHLDKWTKVHEKKTAAKLWKSAKTSVKMQAAMSELHTGARIKETEHVVPDDVVREVDNLDDLASTPYWRQGAEVLYTKEIVELRARLRHDPRVIHELHKFWFTALHCRKHRSGRRSSDSEGDAEDGSPSELTISRRDYMAVLTRVGKATFKHWTLAQATHIASDDWDADARGIDAMPRELFMDAIFECVTLTLTLTLITRTLTLTLTLTPSRTHPSHHMTHPALPHQAVRPLTLTLTLTHPAWPHQAVRPVDGHDGGRRVHPLPRQPL
jgi:hypothetical protein